MTSPNVLSCCLLMRFIAHNELNSPLRVGYNSGRVRQGLRAQMHFSHTNYSPQISAFTQTLNWCHVHWVV